MHGSQLQQKRCASRSRVQVRSTGPQPRTLSFAHYLRLLIEAPTVTAVACAQLSASCSSCIAALLDELWRNLAAWRIVPWFHWGISRVCVSRDNCCALSMLRSLAQQRQWVCLVILRNGGLDHRESRTSMSGVIRRTENAKLGLCGLSFRRSGPSLDHLVSAAPRRRPMLPALKIRSARNFLSKIPILLSMRETALQTHAIAPRKSGG